MGVTIVENDLSAPPSIHKSIAKVMELSDGSIYGLVNNAGFNQFGALEDLSRTAIREQFEINTFAAQDLVNALIPTFRRQGYGRVVQISSMQSFVAMPYQGSYNASKAALEMLTDTMRIELQGTGIHFSILQVGPTTTNINQNALKLFRQKIEIERSAHSVTYAKLVKRLAASQPALFEVEPEFVAKVVYRVLTTRNPKSRYRVTVPSRVMGWVKLVLTDKQLDRFIIFLQGIRD